MWDEQIDDVARRLTASTPPHRLRADVLRLIQEETHPRSPERKHQIEWRLSPVVAAIALILIVGVLVGRHLQSGIRTRPRERTAIDRVASGSAPGRTQRLAAPADSAVTIGAGTPVPARRPGKRPSVTREDPVDFIERLTIAPLGVGSLGLEGIASPASVIPDALDVVPLPAIAPAGESERN